MHKAEFDEQQKIAYEVYKEYKHEIEKYKGKIVAIDTTKKEIVDIVDDDEVLSLIQRISVEYPPNHQIYLLRSGLDKPVAWVR